MKQHTSSKPQSETQTQHYFIARSSIKIILTWQYTVITLPSNPIMNLNSASPTPVSSSMFCWLKSLILNLAISE